MLKNFSNISLRDFVGSKYFINVQKPSQNRPFQGKESGLIVIEQQSLFVMETGIEASVCLTEKMLQ
ncbi:MAG: hypothetical protein SO175_05445 [[Clostridium] scindens]|uniref:hypothetical protein n=1 Tax=Clostridium scindens (strain JCM 10418 / VPI 12708) TaxID=29347 RepID=UPI002A81B869|nr:hypothetical protein [[Clostridium] scindens]MDY4866992.1 hypothetical protein [[Clostridium] scindens]